MFIYLLLVKSYFYDKDLLNSGDKCTYIQYGSFFFDRGIDLAFRKRASGKQTNKT